tara:strand:- start:1834 stop:2274 length:441 start_codon:yes stop_codon:yes gene_type:complete
MSHVQRALELADEAEQFAYSNRKRQAKEIHMLLKTATAARVDHEDPDDETVEAALRRELRQSQQRLAQVVQLVLSYTRGVFDSELLEEDDSSLLCDYLATQLDNFAGRERDAGRSEEKEATRGKAFGVDDRRKILAAVDKLQFLLD